MVKNVKFEFFGVAAMHLLIGKVLFSVIGQSLALSRMDHVIDWYKKRLNRHIVASLGIDRANFAITSYNDRYIYVTGGHINNELTTTVVVFDIQ